VTCGAVSIRPNRDDGFLVRAGTASRRASAGGGGSPADDADDGNEASALGAMGVRGTGPGDGGKSPLRGPVDGGVLAGRLGGGDEGVGDAPGGGLSAEPESEALMPKMGLP